MHALVSKQVIFVCQLFVCIVNAKELLILMWCNYNNSTNH